MLLSDPKWGNGCLALLAGVAGFMLLDAVWLHFHWSVPRPVGNIIGWAICLIIARFILSQIFD